MTAQPTQDAPAAARPARHRNPLERFLSNSFKLHHGHHVDPAGVRGYPVDFGAKAVEPTLLEGYRGQPGRHLWVGHIQRALGSYERWLAGSGEEWLAAAVAAADLLVEHQHSGGAHDGAWVQTAEYPHTFVLRPPWVSAMAQGEGASLLVRINSETGDARYGQAARRALAPLRVPSDQGGTAAQLDGRPFPEEYPTQPPSFVLNGAIYALWGLRDVAVGLGDEQAGREFEAGVDALAASIHRWDTGSWSLYDLFPHRVPNVASAAYHELHVLQLEAMQRLAPRPQLADAARRFARYRDSRACHARAFARKALFRVAVPRSRRVAELLPWARGGGT